MFHVKHLKDINTYKLLYKLAKISYKNGDIPVSSIIFYEDKIIGKGYNNRQKKKEVLGHAEINAIKEAENYLKDWRLNNCVLITTLKPCDMCMEVINASRIDKVYFILDQGSINYDKNFIMIEEENEFIKKYKHMFDMFFKNLR